MSDKLSPDDEAHEVFPDQGHGPKPMTIEQVINHAIHQVKFEHTWRMDTDGGILCMLCLPGGYKIRKGASMEVHANQRNPDTHKQNVIWATLQWLQTELGSWPKWPDAYRSTTDGQLFCHICRTTCGLYDKEFGEKHDQYHASLTRKHMRPNRLLEKASPGAVQREPKQRHALDVILGARDDSQSAPMGTPNYAVPGQDPRQQAQRPQRTDMEKFVHGQVEKTSQLASLTEGERDDLRPYMTVNEATLWQDIPYAVLDQIIETPMGRLSIACGVLAWCAAQSIRRSGIRHCEVEGCEHECHQPTMSASDDEIGAKRPR